MKCENRTTLKVKFSLRQVGSVLVFLHIIKEKHNTNMGPLSFWQLANQQYYSSYVYHKNSQKNMMNPFLDLTEKDMCKCIREHKAKCLFVFMMYVRLKYFYNRFL
jgi:hypothetical protein